MSCRWFSLLILFSVWLSNCNVQFMVPWFDTWNIFIKYPSCTFWIMSICDWFNPIQLSEFAKSWDAIFDLYCSTGLLAMLNHIRLGCLQIYIISSPPFNGYGNYNIKCLMNAGHGFVFVYLVPKVFLGLAFASFKSFFNSSICPTSFAPFLASSSVKFI